MLPHDPSLCQVRPPARYCHLSADVLRSLAFSMRESGMVEEVMIHTSEARLRDSDYALPFLTPPPFTPSPRIPNRHLACEFGMVAEVAAR